MPKHTRIPLESVRTLTLVNGKKTTARRGSPVNQLSCRGRYCKFAPHVVQCEQVGNDGVSPQWRCEGDLPSWLAFGPLEVSCEGWARRGDSDVLAGSCGLQYELVRAGDGLPGSGYVDDAKGDSRTDRVFTFVALAFIAFVLYRIFFSGERRPRAAAAGGTAGGPGGGGGGGGGWGPWGGGGPGGGGWGSGWGSGGDAPPPYKPTEDSSSSSGGPGFWTGMAAGAAGAALYNRATRPAQTTAGPSRRVPTYDYARDGDPSGPFASDDSSAAAGPSRRAAGFGGTSTR